MQRMTFEELLRKEDNGVLLDIELELLSAVVPATGYAHAFCRKVNKMIDAGDLCINTTTYRKVYLPTLAKAVHKELARRWTEYQFKAKDTEEDFEEDAKCAWCGAECDATDLRHTDLGALCEDCICAIRSRGEHVTVYD